MKIKMTFWIVAACFAGQSWCDGRVWTVDDDRGQLPGASFTSIQSAVNAASNGDTIQVYPGTYHSAVVGKTLTLLGAQRGRDARTRNTTTAQESVINTGGTFLLAANDIVMDGFMLIASQNVGGVSLQTSQDFSGYLIVNNIMDTDGPGALLPGNSGHRKMLVRRNRFSGLWGIAIDAEQSEAHNVSVEENLCLGANLGFFGDGHTDLLITKNKWGKDKWGQGGGISFVGRGNPAQDPTTRVRILLNEISGSTYASLYFDRVEEVLVKDNILLNGNSAGIFARNPNINLRLENNRIAGFGGAGIQIGNGDIFDSPPASGVEAIGNEIEDNGSGIVLNFALNNYIGGNNIEDNRTGGILATAYSANNLLLGNQVRGNGQSPEIGQLDCRDDSLEENGGAQTFGTPNTWVENLGSTSRPLHLCVDDLSQIKLGPNLLRNADLKTGSGGVPSDWTPGAYLFSSGLLAWDKGSGTLRIQVPDGAPNDVRWTQVVPVEPNTDYVLEALVKTANVEHSPQAVDAGANLSLLEPSFLPFDHSAGVLGIHDFSRRVLGFNSRGQTSVTVSLRLGIYSGTTTGQVWFKAPKLRKVVVQ